LTHNKGTKLVLHARIPIFENLTLNVRTTGNDATGGLDRPFRQPQAAIDWAMANLDFQNVRSLTIDIGSGTYSRMEIVNSAQGLHDIIITGNNPTINTVYIFTDNEVIFNNVTLNATGSNHALHVTKGYVSIEGSLRITGNTTGFGIHLYTLAFLQSIGNASLNITGTFNIMMRVVYGCVTRLTNSTLTFSGTATSSTIETIYNGIVHLSGNTFAGTVTGRRFSCLLRGVLITGGVSGSIPGSIAGTTDASSFTT